MPDISPEVGGALGRFFHGGAGPSHSNLDSAFAQAGCSDRDPAPAVRRARPGPGSVNKEQRVIAVFAAAIPRGRGRDLTEALLERLRLDGTDFSATHGPVGVLRTALLRCGFKLRNDGYVEFAGLASVVSHRDRPAIEDQLDRLNRAVDDPGLMLGTAKEMLESTAKYVIEELTGEPPPASADFGNLLYLASDRLGIRAADIAATEPESEAIRKILGASWTIAEQTNHLRGRQGTGHGRTLPSSVSPAVAMLVVREACSITEFLFASLDAALRSAR